MENFHYITSSIFLPFNVPPLKISQISSDIDQVFTIHTTNQLVFFKKKYILEIIELLLNTYSLILHYMIWILGEVGGGVEHVR